MTPFRSKPLRLAALLVRMLLGIFFIVSAIAKLIGIDEFEIYIFSYNILSLNLSFLIARIVIAVELLVGLGLLSNIARRLVDTCALLLLVCFVFFLCFALLIGRTDSCHCMGSLVEIAPARSLFKNAILILLLLFSMGAQQWNWRPRWYIWLPACLLPVVGVFIFSAPDNWLFGPSEEYYNQEELDKANSPQGQLHCLNLNQGKHVVAFLTPGCSFCQMADQKLTHIYRRNDLDSSLFIYLTPGQDTTSTDLTVDSTTFLRPAYRMDVTTYAHITYGQRPIVFLVDNGKVAATCHYRNISEEQIVEFLKQ